MKSDKEINLGNQNINPHIPEFQFSATRTLLMDCLSVVSAARLFSSFLFSATQLNWASVFFFVVPAILPRTVLLDGHSFQRSAGAK